MGAQGTTGLVARLVLIQLYATPFTPTASPKRSPARRSSLGESLGPAMTRLVASGSHYYGRFACGPTPTHRTGSDLEVHDFGVAALTVDGLRISAHVQVGAADPAMTGPLRAVSLVGAPPTRASIPGSAAHVTLPETHVANWPLGQSTGPAGGASLSSLPVQMFHPDEDGRTSHRTGGSTTLHAGRPAGRHIYRGRTPPRSHQHRGCRLPRRIQARRNRQCRARPPGARPNCSSGSSR